MHSLIIRCWQRQAHVLLLALCCSAVIGGASGIPAALAMGTAVNPPASQEIAAIPIPGAPTNGAWCLRSSHVNGHAYCNYRSNPSFGQERERASGLECAGALSDSLACSGGSTGRIAGPETNGFVLISAPKGERGNP